MKTVFAMALLVSASPAFAAKPLVQRDLPYAASHDRLQTLDVCAPADGAKHPIVFWIHGGGWTGGDKRDVQHKPAALVQKGFIFVSTNYRLFPGATIRQSAGDVAKAIRWTHDHAAEFGGDATRIFIMGHSAGAQLAALVCTDERYLAAEGLSLAIIRGCVPVDGDTYDVAMEIAAEEPKHKDLHRLKFGDEQSQIDLSPVTHVARGKDIPPFLLIHVDGHRETAPQAERLAKVLQAAGISAKTFPAANCDHKTLNNNLGLPGDQPTEAVLEFMDRVLKK